MTIGYAARLLLAAGCLATSYAWPAPTRAAEQAPPAKAYKSGPGPHEVATLACDWTDDARNRLIPVKVYFPREAEGLLPVILFSHGLGGSRNGYEYLGRHWAGHGYVSVHLQHLGSDAAVWQESLRPMEAMRAAAADPRHAINRAADVRFAIDRLQDIHRDGPGPLQGRLDLGRIGVAGHSFGAWTTLAAAGQTAGGGSPRLADPRVRAAIPMSAPVAARRGDLDAAYAAVRIPCLHMTGTLDSSPIGETAAADRRLPFDHIRGADQYLVIFTGGDHMVFSGQRLRGEGAKDPRFHDLIRQSTTAFWDAHLKGDAAARSWLADGGFAAALGDDGTFEKKLPAPAPASPTPPAPATPAGPVEKPSPAPAPSP